MKSAALIALTCLALVACGGDDNSSTAASGGSGSSGNGSSGGSSGNGPSGSGGSTLTLRYEALTPASDSASFLTLVNGEGAKGYRYLNEGYYSSDGATRSIFVNDGTAQTYTYRLLAAPADAAGFISQANAQGANGYRYEGPLTYGSLYRKDGGSSASYTYAAAATPSSQAAFLSQANEQGRSGYWFVGPLMVGSATANLYMKNNASSATYTYDALTPPKTASDFVAQANSEGAKGYRAKSGMMFGSDTAWVYVKDQTQSPTFAYHSATTQTTGAGFIQQSNDLGAQGSAYFGDLALGGTASFYFKASNCSGFLCTTLNPLTQN